MAEEPRAKESPGVRSELHAVAQLLRQAHHLGPESQRALAGLVDELAERLAPSAVPSPELDHLTASTARLVEALVRKEAGAPVARARGRLEQAILNAEAQAPVAAGLAQRLLDALANIGI